MKTKLLLLLLLSTTFAMEILAQVTSPAKLTPGFYTFNVPFSSFYDPSLIVAAGGDATCIPSGGSTASYLDNIDITETLQNSSGGCIQGTFSLASIGICSGDYLYVYDGPSTASQQVTGSPFTNVFWVIFNGTTSNGSAIITGITTTSNLIAGHSISGTGIPGGVTILSILSGSSIQISAPATASGAPTLTSTPPTTSFTTTSSFVTFRFVSDASNHAKGWVLGFTSATCPTIPPNNNYGVTATSLNGLSCSSPTSGTTYFSTTQAGMPTPCSGTGNYDVWYSFTANVSNPTITVQGGAAFHPVAQLLDGYPNIPTAPGGGIAGTTCLANATAGGLVLLSPTGLTVGNTYYVRVFDALGANPPITYTFTICVTQAPPQDCAGAVSVNSFFTLSGTATNFGVQEYSATTFGCLSSGEHRSLWYKMKVTSVGTIGFTLTPTTGQDIDFAIWGPYANSNCNNIVTAPLRCTYAANSGSAGGLSNSYFDATEPASGDGWLRSIGCPTCVSTFGETAVAVGQYYIFLIDGFSSFNSNSLSLVWTGSSTLPITLTDFHGQGFLDYNLLDWATASEYNNDFWTIERSADGEVFEPITTMDGFENSTTSKQYQYYDRDPLNGNNYYRLKQTDIGGTYSYSNVVLLKNYGSEIEVQDIYPNPTNGAITVNLYSGESYSCTVRVLDQTGKVTLSLEQQLDQGNNSIQLDLTRYHSGVYFLQMINPRSGDVLVKKIVKM